MNKKFGNSWLLLSLILPSLLVTLLTRISPPVLAQSTQQPTQQQRRDIERAVIQKIRVAGLPSPRVEKITLQGQYGLATWLMGEASGMVALNFDRGSLQVVRLGGGVPGAIGISKASAIPLSVAQQLLNRHLGIVSNQTSAVLAQNTFPRERSHCQATLTASEPNSQITFRAGPELNYKSLGYGLVGDQVQVLTLSPPEVDYEKDKQGNGWYRVGFPISGAKGWIREDFLTVQCTPLNEM